MCMDSPKMHCTVRSLEEVESTMNLHRRAPELLWSGRSVVMAGSRL